MPAESYPEAVRQQGGGETWYGVSGLWVDLDSFGERISRQGSSFRVKHAWWTGDGTGNPTDQLGPPLVRAVRLDGPGRLRDDQGGDYASADGFTWWPTVIEFPSRGCWVVTGELQGVTVRFVVSI